MVRDAEEYFKTMMKQLRRKLITPKRGKRTTVFRCASLRPCTRAWLMCLSIWLADGPLDGRCAYLGPSASLAGV